MKRSHVKQVVALMVLSVLVTGCTHRYSKFGYQPPPAKTAPAQQ